jgi:hypothetical protein
MFNQVTAVELQKANNWKTVLSAEITAVGASAGDNGYGVSFDMKDKDSHYMILATNTSNTVPVTVSVKAGNGINATTFEPSVTIGPNASSAIQVESGCFKYVSDSGEMKVESPEASIVGKIFVVASASNATIKVFHLVM